MWHITGCKPQPATHLHVLIAIDGGAVLFLDFQQPRLECEVLGGVALLQLQLQLLQPTTLRGLT